MEQINIFFYGPELIFEFYLMCPCISAIDFNKEIIIKTIINKNNNKYYNNY